MKAWVIDRVVDLTQESAPLKRVDLPKPAPKEGELLIRVSTCGVCHTEIDEIEGRTPPPLYPVVPGHQAVGMVEQAVGTTSGVRPGGRLVINAIRKEPVDQEILLRLDYPRHLWMEKEIKSVANVTGGDVKAFIQLAAEMKMKPEVEI